MKHATLFLSPTLTVLWICFDDKWNEVISFEIYTTWIQIILFFFLLCLCLLVWSSISSWLCLVNGWVFEPVPLLKCMWCCNQHLCRHQSWQALNRSLQFVSILASLSLSLSHNKSLLSKSHWTLERESQSSTGDKDRLVLNIQIKIQQFTCFVTDSSDEIHLIYQRYLTQWSSYTTQIDSVDIS